MVDQVPLYPHQKKAVAELGNGKILAADVGLGKSRTAAAYYMKEEAPRDVYVITTAKKRDSKDWVGEFAQFGVGTARDATVAGVLTVDSWNNIGKYEGVTNAFFVLDEQRLVGSGAWTKSFYKIARANHWILLSATPGDVWLDYVPVFVANGFYKNATDFKRQHVVYSYYGKFPKVERYIGEWRLKKLRDSILVHVPYPRHTVRHTHVIETSYDKSLMERVLKKRWHVYEERPLRDVAELYSVARKVVNSDPTRLEAVKCLMQEHPKLIVFYNFDYELIALRELAGHFASLSRTERSGSSPTTSSRVSVGGDTSTETKASSSRISPRPHVDTEFSQLTKRPHSETPCSVSTAVRKSLPYQGPTSTTTSGGPGSFESHPPFPDEETSRLNDSILAERGSTGRTSKTSSDPFSTGSGNGSRPSPSQARLGRSTSTTGSSCSLTANDDILSTTMRVSLAESLTPVASWHTITLKEQRPSKSSSTPQYDDRSNETFAVAEWNDRIQTESSAKIATTSSSTTSESLPPKTPRTESEDSLPNSEPTSSDSWAIAEWNGHKHEPIPETDRWVYLVQYQAGAEGWNCITTNTIVFYSLTYSYKNWHQAHGRIDRLNTGFTNLHYYVLKSQSWVDNAVWKALRAKKSFNESKHRFDS